ncbi:MAG: carbon storage regulator [Desulfobaccales bacterium]
MLVMTRKVDETILIGDNIRVMVVKIRGNQVLLGIKAPPDLVVLRGEERMIEQEKGGS